MQKEPIDSMEVKLISFPDLSEADKKRIYDWRTDSRIAQNMRTSSFSYDQHLAFIEGLKTKTDRQYFLVTQNNKKIGVISLVDINTCSQKAELGLYVNPEIKGGGKILMDAIFHHAFKVLGLKEVIAEVYEDNSHAIRFYERCGMELVKINQTGTESDSRPTRIYRQTA